MKGRDEGFGIFNGLHSNKAFRWMLINRGVEKYAIVRQFNKSLFSSRSLPASVRLSKTILIPKVLYFVDIAQRNE